MQEFKDRLITARENAGLSQTGLGELCDMASTQVSRYEAGRAVPRRAAMQRLARALGVNYEWLSNGEGPATQLVVRIEDRSAGGSGIVFRADPETEARFLEMAAHEGVEPGKFLVQLIKEQLEKVQTETPATSRLDELSKRIQTLEAKAGLLEHDSDATKKSTFKTRRTRKP